MELAPIVLFVYNRPQHTLRTLEALAKNELAENSVLYIYADGPKPNVDEESILNIEETRRILRLRQWCGKVHIIESNQNKGLADSIIEGVSETVNKYGTVIVLEDDIVTAPFFLTYMNKALQLYKNEEKVMHISAYVPVTTGGRKLPETFFLHLSNCWGWATWKDSWSCFNSNTKELLRDVAEKINMKEFTLDGNYDIYEQLEKNYTGELNTWFVKWYSSIYLKQGLSLFPKKSLVSNIGFDGSGEHCISIDGRYDVDLGESILLKPIKLNPSKYGWDYFRRFYKYGKDSSIERRIAFRIRKTYFFIFLRKLPIYKIYTRIRHNE